MTSIAIIPARGGSKRIPRKNIKSFLGKPIMAYSVAAAIDAGCFSEVMVSTDDAEIAEIAKSLGARVPFMRSTENSSDFAGTAEVIREVVLEYRKMGREFETLCCIYPTAPFVTGAKLRAGMDTLAKEDADCVLPVTEFSYTIWRSLRIENGLALMIWPENYARRSQDLPKAYHDCGQFYCMKTRSLLTQMKLFAERTIPVVVPESEVQDIDNEEDWKIAEIKYRTARGQ